jgi:ABC-2 type transport system permease protein
MKGYFAVFRCRAAALLQYRCAALAKGLTQVFWGFIKTTILISLYSQTADPVPISLSQAIAFIWLGQVFLTLLPWDVDEYSEEAVKNGTIVYALTQPLDLYWVFFTRSLAIRLINSVISMAMLFPLAILFFDLTLPVSSGAALGFALSLLLSALLSSAITAVVIITLFWTLSGEGIQRILPHFCLIFSGMVVPLPLFPDWMQPFLSIQPLRAILDIPCRIYTGIIPLSELPYYFGIQLAWCLSFIVMGRFLIVKAQRKIQIQGG